MEEETSRKDGAMKTWDLRIVVKLLLDFYVGYVFYRNDIYPFIFYLSILIFELSEA